MHLTAFPAAVMMGDTVATRRGAEAYTVVVERVIFTDESIGIVYDVTGDGSSGEVEVRPAAWRRTNPVPSHPSRAHPATQTPDDAKLYYMYADMMTTKKHPLEATATHSLTSDADQERGLMVFPKVPTGVHRVIQLLFKYGPAYDYGNLLTLEASYVAANGLSGLAWAKDLRE